FPFLYLYHSDVDHRDLHSFPTRRSSDLLVLGGEQPEARGELLGAGEVIFQSVAQTGAAERYDALVALTALVADGNCHLAFAEHRSEEHTSELQSRENLVCRLLLEKKNII